MATIKILTDFSVVAEPNSAGGIDCNVYQVTGNVKIGTLASVHPSSGGDKIAGVLPGLDPNYFTLDTGGHLTNG